MSISLRRPAVLLGAAIVGIGGPCVVLLAPAAHAETREAEVVVVDGGADLRDGASSTPIVVPAAGRTASWVAASADGTREALVESVPYDGGDWTGTEDMITVRDAGGRLVRTVDRLTVDPLPTFFIQRPVLGNDGLTVAYDLYDSSDGRHFPEVRDVATGAALHPDVDANADTEVVGFASNTLLVVRSRPRFATESVLQSVAASGSAPPQDVLGAPAGVVSELRLSPNDDRAALLVDGDVEVAPITVSGETVSLGTAVRLTSDGHSSSLSWSRDGTSISFVHSDGSGSSGADLARVAADGGSAPVVTATPEREQAVAVVGLDSTAPAAPVAETGTLRGTSAVVRWAGPTDTDLSGYIVTRRLGAVTQRKVFVPAPATSFADNGLVLGRTYTYVVQPVDRSGNSGPGVVEQVGAVQPRPLAADPTSTTGPRGAFPLTLASTAPAGTAFTVDYQVLPSPTWHRLTTDRPGRRVTVPASIARGGRTLRFRVAATDAAGNASAAVVGGRVVVPYDETAGAWCGACDSQRRSGAYHGGVHTLSAPGQASRITAVGDRLQVVGDRSPRGGRFMVQLRTGGGRWVRLGGVVDTHAATRRARCVLFSHTFSTSLRRTYRLVWVPGPTPTRRVVAIDGFGVRR